MMHTGKTKSMHAVVGGLRSDVSSQSTQAANVSHTLGLFALAADIERVKGCRLQACSLTGVHHRRCRAARREWRA